MYPSFYLSSSHITNYFPSLLSNYLCKYLSTYIQFAWKPLHSKGTWFGKQYLVSRLSGYVLAECFILPVMFRIMFHGLWCIYAIMVGLSCKRGRPQIGRPLLQVGFGHALRKRLWLQGGRRPICGFSTVSIFGLGIFRFDI